MSRTRRASSDGTSGRRMKSCAMPALLTAMSSEPNRSSARATSRSDKLSSAMSPVSAATSASSAAAQASSLVALMSESTSRAPSAAKRFAAPEPKPPAAPLISTVRPSKRPISPVLLDHAGGQPGKQRDRLAVGPGLLRVRGIAVERALVDALADRREPEEGEGEAEGPVVDRADAAPPAVGGDVILLARDAERGAVHAAQTLEARIVRQPPLHALVGNVGKGVAQRRKLPVEHRHHPRFVP